MFINAERLQVTILYMHISGAINCNDVYMYPDAQILAVSTGVSASAKKKCFISDGNDGHNCENKTLVI